MPEKVFYEFSTFVLDPNQHVLLRDGQRVPLHPKTFLLLQTLVEANGQVVSKDELLARVWPGVVVEENNLTKNISLLRKALGNGSESAEFIETIPKIGYRFIAPVRRVEAPKTAALPFSISRERIEGADDVVPDAGSNPVHPSRPIAPGRSQQKYQMLAALLLVIVAAGGWFLRPQHKLTASSPIISSRNPESHQAYLKGRKLCEKRTTEGFQQGIEYLNQAVEGDSRNALAWTSLSRCYQYMSEGAGYSMADMLQQATKMALKATEINENLAEAQSQLGFLEMTQWYMASAERRLKRAVELDPNHAEARARYSIVLLAQGRFDEALAEIRRCEELDASSPQTRIHVSRGLYMSRRYDEAIARCSEFVRLDPEFATAHLYLGLSHYHKGEFAEALPPLQRAVNTSNGRGETKAALAQTYVRLDRREEAVKLLNELIEQADRNMQESYYVATVYIAMNEKEQAFAWLEKAWQQRHPIFATRFKIDPNLDPLRSDPRYADLLRRTGVSQ
jgi:DNA-binding winged helix-turn-helix (wHTH) protein/tetratricopeptide (TPR) repeat protein